MTKLDHHSPTSLKRFDSCPGSWAEHYIDGRRGEVCEPFAFGGLYARVMAEYRQHCSDAGQPQDVDAVADIVNKHFMAQHTVKQDRYHELLGLCERAAMREVLDLDAFIDAEGTYWFDAEGYRVQCRLDQLYIRGNNARIPDDKTFWNLPSFDAVKGDLQLRIQAGAVLQNYPTVDVAEVLFNLPRIGKESPSYAYWRDALPAMEHEVAAYCRRVEDAVEAGEFPYTPGTYCNVCEFKGSCEYLAKAIVNAGNSVGPVVRDDQASSLVAELVALRWWSKQIAAALKPYAMVNGVVRSSDMGYGQRETTSLVYPPQGVFALFDGTEVDPWSVLKVDSTAARRAAKREKRVDEFEALAQTETNHRCDLHKVGGDEEDE